MFWNAVCFISLGGGVWRVSECIAYSLDVVLFVLILKCGVCSVGLLVVFLSRHVGVECLCPLCIQSLSLVMRFVLSVVCWLVLVLVLVRK